MIAIIIFALVLSLLIIVHEFGHFIMAKKNKVRVEQFSLGFGPQIFKKKKGDTEYSVSLLPLGGFVKMSGDNPAEYKGKDDEYLSKSCWQRFQIIFFGPLLNYILGFLLFWFIFFAGYPTLTSKVGGLIDGYGAKEAGLQAGDRIISVGSVNVNSWDELQKEVQKNKASEKVELLVARNDTRIPFSVRIKEKSFDERPGVKRSLGIIGITPFDEVVKTRHGFIQAAWLGAKKTFELTLITYNGIWQLATGRMSMRESMTGPLGIFFITSSVASMGLIAVLHLVAVLSVSLAIFNLLPLPVLDGGHIFLLALEKIRRKALSVNADRIVNNIGFTMIISLAVFVTYNDILRVYGDKLSKFFGH
jgi:regulator of sigma E protease